MGDANCMDVSDGIGLLMAVSRVNHSCSPNVSRSMLPNGQIALVAMQKISAGDEIFTAYMSDADLLKPQAKRAEILATWDFRCECPRCKGAGEKLSGDGSTDDASLEAQI